MPLQAVYSRTAGQGMETKQGKAEFWQSPERQSKSYSFNCSRWELETQLLSFHMSVSVSNFNLLLFKLPKHVLSKIEYMFLSSGAALLSSSQNQGIICKSHYPTRFLNLSFTKFILHSHYIPSGPWDSIYCPLSVCQNLCPPRSIMYEIFLHKLST